jgi:dipeptide/tripeptide permease
MLTCLSLVAAASSLFCGLTTSLALAGVYISFAILVTVLNTVAMSLARQGREGTDFTVFLSLAFLGGMISMGLSGVVAQNFGYAFLFSLSAGLCFLVGVIFTCLNRRAEIYTIN